jgi:hypothetical protein
MPQLPAAGDRPSLREIAILFAIAAIVGLALVYAWRGTADKDGPTPVIGEEEKAAKLKAGKLVK